MPKQKTNKQREAVVSNAIYIFLFFFLKKKETESTSIKLFIEIPSLYYVFVCINSLNGNKNTRIIVNVEWCILLLLLAKSLVMNQTQQMV